MNPKLTLTAALVLAFGTVHTAGAAEIVVTQKAKKFDVKKVSLKAGDSIKFVNSDSITHNIYSSKGLKFDLGAQKPGASSSKVFDKAGKFKVRCAIHPKMKVTVNVN
jgi:plastocyanin